MLPVGIFPTVPTVSQITVTSAVPLSLISLFSIAEKMRLSDATLSPTEITLPGVPVIVTLTCDATPDFLVMPCSAALKSRYSPLAVSAKPFFRISSSLAYAVSNSSDAGFVTS